MLHILICFMYDFFNLCVGSIQRTIKCAKEIINNYKEALWFACKKDTNDISILISDYLCFLIDRNITSDTIDIHENVLHLFLRFISENSIETFQIFASKVLDQFYRDYNPKNGRTVMNGFIRYLKMKNIVCDDLIASDNDLCGIFSDYLKFFQRCGTAQYNRQQQVRNTLKAFNHFLLSNQYICWWGINPLQIYKTI